MRLIEDWDCYYTQKWIKIALVFSLVVAVRLQPWCHIGGFPQNNSIKVRIRKTSLYKEAQIPQLSSAFKVWQTKRFLCDLYGISSSRPKSYVKGNHHESSSCLLPRTRSQDPCDKMQQTVKAVLFARSAAPPPLGFHLPASSHKHLLSVKAIHFAPPVQIASNPAIHQREKLKPHPYHIGWKRRTTARVRYLVNSSQEIQIKNSNDVDFWGCVLFLDGTFVGLVVSCHDMQHRQAGRGNLTLALRVSKSITSVLMTTRK